MKNPPELDDDWGYPHDSGNLHLLWDVHGIFWEYNGISAD
jgi:hypothetical protein